MKPRKLIVLLVVPLLVITLSACRSDVLVTLYSSDILAVLEGESIAAPMEITMEVVSEDTCREEASSILEVLSGHYDGSAQFIECRDQDMTTFLVARVMTPIRVVHDLSMQPRPEGHSRLPYLKPPDGISIGYLTNHRVIDRLYDDLTQGQAEPDLHFHAVFENDERQPVTVAVEHAFANDWPVVGSQNFSLRQAGVTQHRIVKRGECVAGLGEGLGTHCYLGAVMGTFLILVSIGGILLSAQMFGDIAIAGLHRLRGCPVRWHRYVEVRKTPEET